MSVAHPDMKRAAELTRPKRMPVRKGLVPNASANRGWL